MNIIPFLKRFCNNPFLVLISFFVLLGIGIYFLFSYEELGVVISMVSLFLLVVSMIVVIAQRKWKLFFTYLLTPLVLTPIAAIIVLFVSFNQMPAVEIIKGSEEFYADKLKYHTKIKGIPDLEVYCKQDSIYGIGPGNGDYRAFSIYHAQKENIRSLHNVISADSTYQKVPFSELKAFVDESTNADCPKNLSYMDYGYISGSGMYSYILFSEDEDFMFFGLDYY